jgi:TatD DNase family protein
MASIAEADGVDSPPSSPSRKGRNNKKKDAGKLSFKERQELKRQQAREKRSAKQKCYICGQAGHTRKQCPGIEDGGKGQSVHRSKKGSGGSKRSKRGERGQKKNGNRGRAASNASDSDQATALALASEVPVIDSSTNILALCSRASVNSSTASLQNICQTEIPKNVVGCISYFSQPSEFNSAFSSEHGGIKVFCTAGIHPYYSDNYDKSDLQELEKCFERPDVVGLGPIGIDYSTRCAVESEVQIVCFADQVKLGVAKKVPILIHMKPELRYTENYKRAQKDIVAVLREHVPVDHPMCLHAYTGDADAAGVLLKAFTNLYVSFSPIITFSKAKHVRELAFDVPNNRMMLCSNGPADSPVAQIAAISKKSLSEPGHVLFIAAAISLEKKVSLDEILEFSFENTKTFFGLDDAFKQEKLAVIL